MYKLNSLTNILFLDIETAAICRKFEDLDARAQFLWDCKADALRKRDPSLKHIPTSELFLLKAGIFAEYSKILCISLAYFKKSANSFAYKCKTLAQDDEKALLESFLELVESNFNRRSFKWFCGHNIREFDIPFICRRALINGLPLPNALDIAGKKPWELRHLIDTLELWKFGDYKHYCSLDTLCHAFGIESPKSSMSGAAVHLRYWNASACEEIAEYCEKDVKATARVFLRMNGLVLEDF